VYGKDVGSLFVTEMQSNCWPSISADNEAGGFTWKPLAPLSTDMAARSALLPFMIAKAIVRFNRS